ASTISATGRTVATARCARRRGRRSEAIASSVPSRAPSLASPDTSSVRDSSSGAASSTLILVTSVDTLVSPIPGQAPVLSWVHVYRIARLDRPWLREGPRTGREPRRHRRRDRRAARCLRVPPHPPDPRPTRPAGRPAPCAPQRASSTEQRPRAAPRQVAHRPRHHRARRGHTVDRPPQSPPALPAATREADPGRDAGPLQRPTDPRAPRPHADHRPPELSA